MAKSASGGAMNRHNALQHIHNKAKYERQFMITAKNKEKKQKRHLARLLKKKTKEADNG